MMQMSDIKHIKREIMLILISFWICFNRKQNYECTLKFGFFCVCAILRNSLFNMKEALGHSDMQPENVPVNDFSKTCSMGVVYLKMNTH